MFNPHWLVTSALCLSACASDAVLGNYTESSCDFTELPADTTRVRVYLSTFWEDKKETSALGALLDHDDTFVYEPSTKKTRVASQLQLKEAFKDKRLPDVFQANGGSDVLRWVKRDAEASSVCPLNELARTYGWQDTYFAPSLAPVSCVGSLYALPVGIHKLNVLFYNRKLFASLKAQAAAAGQSLVEPAQLGDVQQLVKELDQAAELGAAPGAPSFAPLAVGADRAWPLTIMAFENVLLSLGDRAYQTLWQGGLQRTDDERRSRLETSLKDMLETMRQLMRHTRMSADMTWQDAVKQVGSGEALFTITGDWGWAQLEDDQVPDVAAVAFPGTAGSFVYTPDSFAVPRELGANGSRARAFLQKVVASPEALLSFSALKHSIPARQDVDPADLAWPEQRETYREFTACAAGGSGCELVLAASGLAPPPGFDSCFDDLEALLAMAVTGEIPASFYENPRDCENPWPPADEEEAEERVLAQLLEVATSQFAADCR